MKTVLTTLLYLLPYVLLAQPSHWRYSVSLGLARPSMTLETNVPIPDNRFAVNAPTRPSLQLSLERSLTPNLSLRGSTSFLMVGRNFRTAYTIRDSMGRVWGRASSGGGGSGPTLAVGTLGVTYNTKAYGRTIFNAGADVVIRYNAQPFSAGSLSGGSGGSYVVIRGGDTTRNTSDYLFESRRTSPVTFGLAVRVGLDHRISKRGFISLETSYTHGFGYVHNAVSTELAFDGTPYTGRYFSRASNVAVRIGYKHNLFRVRPTDPLQFTPYNQPDLPWHRFLTPAERAETFRARSWLYEFRGNYRPFIATYIAGAGANAGYFFANRHMIGLSADYQGWGHSFNNRLEGNLWQVGPFIRTYAGRGRVAPYLEAGYQFGRVTGFSGSQVIQSVPLTAGLSVRVNESVRINASYMTRYVRTAQYRGHSYAMPQFSVSFSPKAKSTTTL